MHSLPHTFGDYTLEERLGQGGMAEVFRARHNVDGTRVCVKRILPSLANAPGFAGMLRDEANVALRMKHPNLVQAYELGDVNGVLFVAMELVEGTNLARVMGALREGREPFPLAHALHIARLMCRGLHYAHTAKSDDGKALDVVHRDVSPDNVLLGNDGTVKVADFGIARASERTTHTRTGAIKGKPQYMAPEQAAGDRCDHRVDQFATAVVLWEMLAGRTLFGRTEVVATLDAVARCKVPPFSRRDVPSEVEVALHTALARDPAQRYPTIAAFGDALIPSSLASAVDNVDLRPLIALAAGAPDARKASGARAIRVDDGADAAGGNAGQTMASRSRDDMAREQATASALTTPSMTSASAPSVSSVFTSTSTPRARPAVDAVDANARTIPGRDMRDVRDAIHAPTVKSPVPSAENAVVMHMTPAPHGASSSSSSSSSSSVRISPRAMRYAATGGIGLMFAAVLLVVTREESDPIEPTVSVTTSKKADVAPLPPPPSRDSTAPEKLDDATEDKPREAASVAGAPAKEVADDDAQPKLEQLPPSAETNDSAKRARREMRAGLDVDDAPDELRRGLQPSVEDVVAAHRAELRKCAPRGTKANVRVHFTVGAGGRVDAVVVESSGGAKDVVVQCMTRALSTWTFAGVRAATTTLTIP